MLWRPTLTRRRSSDARPKSKLCSTKFNRNLLPSIPTKSEPSICSHFRYFMTLGFVFEMRGFHDLQHSYLSHWLICSLKLRTSSRVFRSKIMLYFSDFVEKSEISLPLTKVYYFFIYSSVPLTGRSILDSSTGLHDKRPTRDPPKTAGYWITRWLNNRTKKCPVNGTLL